jgi:hypothetical protein
MPIEIIVQGRKYYVTFIETAEKVGKNVYYERVTTCIIRTYDPLYTFTGVAICNPNDLPDEKIGRRVAFGRAAVRAAGSWRTLREFRHALRYAMWLKANPDQAAEVARILGQADPTPEAS